MPLPLQRLRTLWSLVVMALAFTLAVSVAKLHARDDTRFRFDIPAGDAVMALRRFASQSRVQLIYSGDAVAGVKTSAIKGELTPIEALERMLQGTRLTAKHDERTGAFAITSDSVESASPAKDNSSVKKKAEPVKTPQTLIHLPAWLAFGLATATAADGPAFSADTTDNIVLSPFEVSTSADNGYLATNSSTGTRISIPLVQLPFTANVITSAFIQDNGWLNLTEATRYVPSLRRGSNNNEAFTLRGFNTGTPRRNYFSNPGLGRSRTDNAEIERIEVVKGPTSVLFGFGGPGGVVNILTKKPLAKPETSLSAEYGSFNHRRFTIDSTGPLLTRGESQLRYRVIGTRQKSEGFRDFERYDQTFLNTQLQWSNRRTTARVEFRFQNLDEGETFILQPFDEATGTVQRTERSFNVAGPEAFARYKEISTYFELTHNFNESISLRAAAVDGDHYFNALRRVGASMTPDFRNVILTGNRHDDKRQLRGWQIDVTGQWGTPIGKLRLVGGANEQDFSSRTRTWANTRLPQRNFPIFDIALRDYSTGLESDYLPQASGYNNDGNVDRVFYAIGSLETLQERLTIFAGVGRMESKTSQWSFLSAAAPTLGDYRTTKPQIGASYRITPGVHVFANFTQSASPNARFPGSPETGESVEVGIKFNREKYSGGLTFFDSTRESIQVGIFNNLTSTTTFELSGEERARGFEAEFQLNPTSQFQILGSYSFLDTEVVSDKQRPGRVGTELANAPEHSFRLWTKYQFKEGPLNKLWVGVGYLYTSWLRPGDNPARYLLKAAAWDRIDVSAGYPTTFGRYRVDWRVNLENITNEDYIGVALHRGQPFAAKLTAILRF